MNETPPPLDDVYQLGVKVAGIGLGRVDYLADTITLDAVAARLFDLPADTPVSRDTLHDRIHPEDRPEIDHQVEKLLHFDHSDVIEVEHRVVHDDGAILWLNARKQVQFADHEGARAEPPVSGMVAILDVTARHRDQEQIQFLLDELNHRSKNLLTVVQGIARRTMESGAPETFMDRFAARLTGLIHNHDAMVKGQWQHADLTSLATSHLSAFGEVGGRRIRTFGPSVRLSAAQSQAIGMALHELGTNATKYGALSVNDGSVTLEWGPVAQTDLFAITWSETGGPEVSAPARSGFGQKVIDEIAASAVGGEVALDYAPEGLRWQLSFPMADLA